MYRVCLELRSRLGTPLVSDTLWGHLAWGYRYLHGEKRLTQWLEAYEEQTPLALSDPLPRGAMPQPALPPPPLPVTRPKDTDADEVKKLRKSTWISMEAWTKAATALCAESLQQAVENHPLRAPMVKESLMTHAGVNRLTGGTEQEGGGAIFTDKAEHWSEEDGGSVRFDVWTWWTGSPAELRELFRAGLAGGYGRDGASGAGHLVVREIEERSLPTVEGANAMTLLGCAVPRPTDPARGFFVFETRAGRLGGTFATGATPSGSTQRQKRPVTMLRRGSVLLGTTEHGLVGRTLRGVHEDEAIRHCGVTIAAPCRLTEALVKEAV